MNNYFDQLLLIPCDYDGYDLVFQEKKTEPELYQNISRMISNGIYDISGLESYRRLCMEPDEDRFYEFYDEWMEDLKEEGLAVHLEMGTPVEEFARSIAGILRHFRRELDIDGVAAEYRRRLKELGIEADVYYDILEANVVAGKIRNLGLELIALFDGNSNDDFCVIPVSQITEMKEMERRIRG